MKLVKVRKTDDESDTLIEKLGKGWTGVIDAKARFKVSKNEKYRKFVPVCEKIANEIDKIIRELQAED